MRRVTAHVSAAAESVCESSIPVWGSSERGVTNEESCRHNSFLLSNVADGNKTTTQGANR